MAKPLNINQEKDNISNSSCVDKSKNDVETQRETSEIMKNSLIVNQDHENDRDSCEILFSPGVKQDKDFTNSLKNYSEKQIEMLYEELSTTKSDYFLAKDKIRKLEDKFDTLQKEYNVLRDKKNINKLCFANDYIENGSNETLYMGNISNNAGEDLVALSEQVQNLVSLNETLETNLEKANIKINALNEHENNLQIQLRQTLKNLSEQEICSRKLSSQIFEFENSKKEWQLTRKCLEDEITALKNELVSYQNFSGKMKDHAGSSDKKIQEMYDKFIIEKENNENFLNRIVELQDLMELMSVEKEYLSELLQKSNEEVRQLKDHNKMLKLELELNNSGFLDLECQKSVMDDRLREALFKLRQINIQQELEFQLKLSTLECKANLSESRNSEIQKLIKNKETSEQTIEYLKMQLDAALDSEGMIFTLMEKNVLTSEELTLARSKLLDLEILSNINSELDALLTNQSAFKDEVISIISSRFQSLTAQLELSQHINAQEKNKCMGLESELAALKLAHKKLLDNAKSNAELLGEIAAISNNLNKALNELALNRLAVDIHKIGDMIKQDESELPKMFLANKISNSANYAHSLYLASKKMKLNCDALYINLLRWMEQKKKFRAMSRISDLKLIGAKFHILHYAAKHSSTGIFGSNLDLILQQNEKIIETCFHVMKESCSIDEGIKIFSGFLLYNRRILSDLNSFAEIPVPQFVRALNNLEYFDTALIISLIEDITIKASSFIEARLSLIHYQKLLNKFDNVRKECLVAFQKQESSGLVPNETVCDTINFLSEEYFSVSKAISDVSMLFEIIDVL